MKLADWFKERNADGSRRSKGKFAERIGKSPSTVTGYLDGSVWPTREAMQAIERETGGQVTANDFLHVEAAE
jgi:DNA-binding transcriptional regulator YdaS (Cro superfamily)